DDREGWAYSTSASLKLADFITINGNLSENNPYFHPLEQRFGSRVAQRNWGVSADIDLAKLLPGEMRQSSLKFNYSHNERVGKPLYLPGTDILVDEAVTQLEDKLKKQGFSDSEAKSKADSLRNTTQTIETSDTYSFSSIRIKIPTDFWLIRDTWNNLNFGFNYNKTYSRNPTTIHQSNWLWNFTASYQFMFNPNYFIRAIEIPVLGTIFEFFTDLKQLRIYYTPSSLSWNFGANRSRGTTITRQDPSRPSISRDFKTNRGLQFGWRFTEGGFLNPSLTYGIEFQSTIVPFETKFIDSVEVPRAEKEIFRELFSSKNYFGKDINFSQRIELRTQPKVPSLFNLDKYLNFTTGYSVDYRWQNDLRQVELGRAVSYSNNISLGFTFKLKQLFDPLFKESSTEESTQPIFDPRRGRGRDREEEPKVVKSDSTQTPDSTQIEDTTPRKSPITTALNFLKSVSKWLFFEYENVAINFSQNNNSQNSGIKGEGTGFSNFWNFFSQSDQNGPPRSYMLGLGTTVGARAPNGNLTDAVGQRNSIDFRTSRPLWEGARIDLTWKTGWNYNRSTSIQTDSLGVAKVVNMTSTGSTERSFLSLPPVLLFSFFKNGIKRVNELFDPNSANPNENLSQAFVEGFETLPILGKLPFLKDFINYIPRPNWSLNWDGLERLPLFNTFAQRVSLSHSYTSNYSRGWKINPDGQEETQSQKVMYGFQPFLGLSITFEQLWNGNLSANIKFGRSTTYDLGVTTKNITETFSQDINVSASYSKSGFDLPLFGISLKNDIGISLSFTQMKNTTVIFDMMKFKEEGTPQDGTVRTTLEPRIRYVMSSRLTLSIFYKRSSVKPEGASKIPPTTTNEAGLDVHITI
ncbi:MAG: cell surface protein SprA, partial [Ignavibacteria bacterium]|nr:cell surface protein SprA [Ignavibacteria bacterium]